MDDQSLQTQVQAHNFLSSRNVIGASNGDIANSIITNTLLNSMKTGSPLIDVITSLVFISKFKNPFFKNMSIVFVLILGIIFHRITKTVDILNIIYETLLSYYNPYVVIQFIPSKYLKNKILKYNGNVLSIRVNNRQSFFEIKNQYNLLTMLHKVIEKYPDIQRETQDQYEYLGYNIYPADVNILRRLRSNDNYMSYTDFENKEQVKIQSIKVILENLIKFPPKTGKWYKLENDVHFTWSIVRPASSPDQISSGSGNRSSTDSNSYPSIKSITSSGQFHYMLILKSYDKTTEELQKYLDSSRKELLDRIVKYELEESTKEQERLNSVSNRDFKGEIYEILEEEVESKNSNNTLSKYKQYRKLLINHFCRPLESIFFKEKDQLLNILTNFKKKQGIYEKLPHRHKIGIMIYGKPGGGKCLSANEKVMMFSGKFKVVQDIKVGDQLMGDDSTPRNVLSTCKGQEKMYKIKQNKGEDYIVNESHILSLKLSCTQKSGSTGKTNEFRIINGQRYRKDDIVDISVRDYLLLSGSIKAKLKGYKTQVIFAKQEVPIDPYIIGLWLGDGNSDGPGFTNQDATILKYLANKLPEYECYLQSHTSDYSYRINGNGSTTNRGQNYFNKVLKQLNLINNKHVPEVYKYNSRENQLKLLAGILDTDGHYRPDHVDYDFIQKNYTLAKDIEYIARCLGFSTQVVECKKSCMYKGEKQEGIYYRQHISGNGIEEIPCLIPRKKSNIRKQVKNNLYTGIIVEEVNQNYYTQGPEYQYYYGFELDGNGRFILKDHTVTHNTSLSVAIATELKRNVIRVSLKDKSLDDAKLTYILNTYKKGYVIILDELDTHKSLRPRTEEETSSNEEVGEYRGYGGGYGGYKYGGYEDYEHEAFNDNITRDITRDQDSESEPGEQEGQDGKTDVPILEKLIKKISKNKTRKWKGWQSPEKLTLGSFLEAMDGISSTEERVVIAMTNHPKHLDPAIIRPGRFDIVINMDSLSTDYMIAYFKYLFEGFQNITPEEIEQACVYATENKVSSASLEQASVERYSVKYGKTLEQCIKDVHQSFNIV